ncbi:MAG TPA: hypothetical protein VGJ22_05585 [Anaerolineales bacterium]
MQFNLFIVLLIALVVMFFGYFFGLFEGRNQGYKKGKAEQDAGTLRPESAAPAPVAATVVEDPGLLRLKEENGQFRVDMDGARLSVDTLTPEKRKRLIELITRLRPWVDGRPTAQSEPLRPPPAPAPVSVPVSQPAGLTSPVTAVITSPLKKEEPAAPKTMVAQIDAILQERMADGPLARRGIRLEESPGGSVTVVVGISRYTGVSDVPDPEVQAAIRAAIAEWERKFTPGL